MRLYLEMIKNALQTRITYRSEVVLRLFNGIIILFIQVSIWSALLYRKSITLQNIGSINLQDMITYSILSAAISTIVTNNVIYRVEQKIRTGEIAMDLIKPIDFKLGLISETIGNNTFRAIFELIPLLVLGALLFGMKLPTLANLLLFLASIVNGAVILFYISYIFALFAFWYMVTWHMEALLNIMNLLLSGSFIPIWFFPQFLMKLSNYLPFRLIYFAPISVYLGKAEGIGGIILQQIIWIIILWSLEKIIWSRAINKLIIQGG